MATVTTASADNVLKSYYLGAVTDQLNKTANPLLARIQQTSSDVWGKDIRKAVRYGVNGGISAGSEEGDLPEARGNNYEQFVLSLKNLYGTIEITDKALRASANGEGAFVNLLNDEMDGLIKSSSFNFGRMLFGDGSGLLGTVVNGTSIKLTMDSIRNLTEGMRVDVYTSDNRLVASGSAITVVNRPTKVVTISPGLSSDVTDGKMYLSGAKDKEITGLGAIFGNSAMLYGITRSQWLKPYVKTDVGDITENEIQKAIDEVEMRSGSRVNFIVCSWGVRRALIEVLSKYRQTESIELEGGFRAISFNGIPVVADRFCPEGTMYLLNTDDFGIHQLCDWQWLEGEDGKILKQIAGKPVYTATLVKYAELLCYRPCGQAMLSGITEG